MNAVQTIKYCVDDKISKATNIKFTSFNSTDIQMLTSIFQDFFVCPMMISTTGIVDWSGADTSFANIVDDTLAMFNKNDETEADSADEHTSTPSYKFSNKPNVKVAAGSVPVQVLDAFSGSPRHKVLVTG